MSKPDSPWRGMAIKRGRDNASRQRRALKKMSLFERQCGISVETFDAFQEAQRAAVRQRYGLLP